MTMVLESAGERFTGLPQHEFDWIEDRVTAMIKLLEDADKFPEIEFDGRPYDSETAHLRLMQYHQDSIDLGFSDQGRQTILDLAIDYGIAAGLSQEVIQNNWLKAFQEERHSNIIEIGAK